MSKTAKKMSVLFVCLGNIIRSPTCEGLLRHLATSDIIVDSAAVTSDDLDQHPDPEVQQLARQHGYDISSHISKKIKANDFKKFDLIVSLEPYVFKRLKRLAPQDTKATICEFVPDVAISNPWMGSHEEFVEMYGEIEAGMKQFVAKWIPRDKLKDPSYIDN